MGTNCDGFRMTFSVRESESVGVVKKGVKDVNVANAAWSHRV